MNIIGSYQHLWEESPARLVIVLAMTLIIMGLYTWNCVDDSKHRSIKTWKLMLAPTVLSLYCLVQSILPEETIIGCGCPHLWPFVLGSYIIWLVIMVLNIFFNKQRFIGQADVTLLSYVILSTAAYCMWISGSAEPMFTQLYILDTIFTVALAFVLGGFFMIVIYGGSIFYHKFKHKLTMKQAIKDKQRSPLLWIMWIPMLTMCYLLLTT